MRETQTSETTLQRIFTNKTISGTSGLDNELVFTARPKCIDIGWIWAEQYVILMADRSFYQVVIQMNRYAILFRDYMETKTRCVKDIFEYENYVIIVII